VQKTILITGCSSGIGLSAAQILKQRGYRVFATARKEADVEKLKGLGLESLMLDVNDSHSIKAAIDKILSLSNGTLDAVFSNAGFVTAGAVEDLNRDMMREQFETNVFGCMEVVNLILPIMRKQGYGRIVLNTSILGIITMPYRGAYAASKFALEGFGQTLRQELRDSPISVSMIVPGPIQSKLRENAYKIYKKTLEPSPSFYKNLYQKMEKYFFNPTPSERRVTLPPDAVVKKLIQALESPRPKAHYYIGLPAYIFAFLRRVLPDSALNWVIAKIAQAEAN